MKKTYVTSMPNHIGAFLQASKRFAELGINITRVSYNTAVDSHMLFIEAQGTPEQLRLADEKLEKIGYLQKNEAEPDIILIEFRLKDRPGSVTKVLELIESYHFNISYLSSQENNTEYQLFKMGLFVENSKDISAFLEEAKKLCNVRVIDYNRSEKIFDNSIFYKSFVSGLAQMTGIPDKEQEELLVNSNLAMHILDEQGLSPYKTFDSIYCFSKLLAESRAGAFSPRITRHEITSKTEIILIEPNCGSNTAILKSGDACLFIDSGYACYETEMLSLFRKLVPSFDTMKKRILLTHADVDHGGLLPLFDEIIASKKSADCLKAEHKGENGFREKNPLHKPYIRICKILTAYTPPLPEKITVPWPDAKGDGILENIGSFSFAELLFEVYEGKGGHLPGEIVLIERKNRLVFTGDIYVNISAMTPEQKQYNRYAPILMTSVDTNAELCSKEREKILSLLCPGEWKIFGAHGAKKDMLIS